MIAFKPLAFTPSWVRPSKVLGQAVTAASPGGEVIDPGALKAVAAVVGLGSLAFSAATAWVGITTGMEKKGWLKVAGWVVGVGAALGALVTVAQIGVVLLASPEKLKSMIAERNL